MINSRIYDFVVVHKLTGELAHRDIIGAKAFVQTNLEVLPDDFCVLWDLRESVLSKGDDDYRASVKAFVDPNLANKASARKRAFLVSSDRHAERVSKALLAQTAPWPWRVFTTFDRSVAWLRP